MHCGPIGHIHANWQPSSHRYPADRSRLGTAAGSGSGELRPKPPLDKRPERLPEFRSPFLRSNKQVVRKFDSRLHA